MEKAVKKHRVEAVKDTILKQLNMKKRPPKTNRTHIVIPKPILNSIENFSVTPHAEEDRTQAILQPTSGIKFALFALYLTYLKFINSDNFLKWTRDLNLPELLLTGNMYSRGVIRQNIDL